MTKTATILTLGLSVATALGLAVVAFLLVKKYRGKNPSDSSGNGKTTSVLFIGDSTTAGDGSFADIVGKSIGNYTKLAKVGISTSAMIPMLTDEINNDKYGLVAILGGYNDNYALGGSSDVRVTKTIGNLQKMYDLAHSKGAKVVAITPPASSGNKNYTIDKQAYHNGLNSWIKQSNADYVVDWYSLETGGGTSPKAGMTGSDGEHLTASAQKLLANTIMDKIA